MVAKHHIFDRSGFASLTDLRSSNWKRIFEELDTDQARFLALEEEFRSKEYRWPRDPLHTWSRLWEYPFVFHHVDQIRRQRSEARNLNVADIGSGVTFFPFSVARLGYNVTCVDVDPICARDIPKASRVVACDPGKVSCSLIAGEQMPLEDCSQDVVYCISVLEHIVDYPTTLAEISRILKPGGVFILTVDIDIRGNFELGVGEFRRLQTVLNDGFEKLFPDKAIHPADCLTTSNSPFRLADGSLMRRLKRGVEYMRGKYQIYGDLGVGVFLTVYADVLLKKA